MRRNLAAHAATARFVARLGTFLAACGSRF